MVVYVDVLVFLNTLVTYFLLLSVCRFFKSRPKLWRIICGSLAGGFSALVIFLPSFNIAIDFLIKVIICALIVFITFSYKNKVRYLKYCLAFLAVSYVYAGAMLAIWFMFKPSNMALGNTVVYFNISPIVLISSTIVCYVFIRIFTSFTKHSQDENLLYDCLITYGSITAKAVAINDTGNSLTDPFFGSPVAIFSKSELGSISNIAKTYIIPYGAISGKGFLKAFRPNSFEIVINGKRRLVKNITIGICDTKVHKQFDGLINPSIIELSEEYKDEIISKI